MSLAVSNDTGRPPAYRHITVAPLSGFIGAEVGGVDFSQEPDDAVWAEIERAFLDHSVLVFRDQDLTPERHKAVARRFGPFTPVPFIKTLDEHPEIIEIVREPREWEATGVINFGGEWHSDFSFMAEPAKASLLYAREVPPHGGDTLWASGFAAYRTLSAGMRQTLEGLRAVHSGRRSYGSGGRFAGGKDAAMSVKTSAEGDAEVVHPIIRTQVETGRKALWVNEVYTIRIDGWTEEESAPLIGWLHQHMIRPQHTCRVRWAPRTLTIWDNRSTQHFALDDYPDHRRVMHRITTKGERPV